MVINETRYTIVPEQAIRNFDKFHNYLLTLPSISIRL